MASLALASVLPGRRSGGTTIEQPDAVGSGAPAEVSSTKA